MDKEKLKQELDYLKLELDNFICGNEISKSFCPEYWGDDDERALQMFYRIARVLSSFIETYDFLERFEKVKGYSEGEMNIILATIYEMETGLIKEDEN